VTSFLNVVLVITFYQTGPDGLFYFSKVFNLILQSANSFYLMFDKNTAYIATRLGGNEESKSSKLSKDILNAFSKNGNTRPQAGEWVKLGRVKTERLKDGYKIKTRKVTFDLKKASNGAYQSQDGTYWQFVPKKVVENKQ